MSFAIIISEKGGAERRELFEKNEITVGRVQGNDLMLPKGNVSKRHAKLMFRDGRFIVADLKSTNGTYVNGRKIAQATIVREGDKIYVGDFVLRFESAPGMVIAPESAANAPGPRDATPSELGQMTSMPPASPLVRDAVSHYPLEHDPDESGSSAPKVVVPNPARAPSLPRGPGSTQLIGASGAEPSTVAAPPATASIAPPPPPLPRASLPSTAPHGISTPPPVSSATSTPLMSAQAVPPLPSYPARSSTGPSAAQTSPPREPRSREVALFAVYRQALSLVVDRCIDLLDMDAPSLDEALVERTVREQIQGLRSSGEILDGVELEALVRDAIREISGLGPLTGLLDDDEVSSVHIARYDHILVGRGSSQIVLEPAFSREDSLRRALARLCQQVGQPLSSGESIIERRLPKGSLLAVLPPLSLGGAVVTLRRKRPEVTLAEDAVRAGIVSRSLWNFLTQCFASKLNVLVVAPSGQGFASVLSSLLGTSSAEERIVSVQSPELAFMAPSHVVSFGADNAKSEALVRAALRMSPERLVVVGMRGALAAATLEAIGERSLSVLAAVAAPGGRQGLARLVPELCAARPGISPDAAREWLASSFDLVIEVGKLRDGRYRVMRVAETIGVEAGAVALRDIFTFTVDRAAAGGVLEGTFASTGVVPRFVEELRQRGVSFEPSYFERAASR